ncbi:RNA-binding domain-containing protein [Polyporus arcularius HHB13444]|uniref:RNA-binding domain-containing protein n=1 Tax=Polyporus arcularius HHB13444 TaxID=1314778 RepID=A0A5C3PIX1_9APHY|nr:RNA-binding domain-containing protein [Polyporus arcularius HHB13444]
MAKATATSEKPARLAKKKSQDLKADAPAKAKKAKTVEQQPAAAPADPSSSKPKKAKKKSEDGAKEVVEPVKADAKKDRKKKESAVVVEQPKPDEKAEVSGEKKRKRKAAEPAEQETSAQPLKETKKKRTSIAEPAPAVEEEKVETGDKKKKRKAKAAPEPQPQPEEEAEEAAEEQSEKEEEDEFYGFESDDDDSSDEDEMVDDIPGIDIGKLPTIARDDETVKRKLEKAKRKPTEDRGVIYLGRIPHGFYEDQMRAYFSQFGTVTRLRLSRNKKTGKPKHYGFVEFDSSSVAKIVAETMDNYLLMGHILTCKVIPKDQVHPELWVGSNKKWRAVPRDRVVRVAHNKPRTVEETARAEARLLKRQEQRKRKLEEAGIKYDFEAVAYKKKPKATEA